MTIRLMLRSVDMTETIKVPTNPLIADRSIRCRRSIHSDPIHSGRSLQQALASPALSGSLQLIS